MGKVSKVRANVTAKRKPKLSSGKGGFLVAKVAAVNKNKKKSPELNLSLSHHLKLSEVVIILLPITPPLLIEFLFLI